MPVDPFEHLQSALRDRYRVERPLGRGGMALVYLAHDLKHDRQVAIKVLRPELTAMLGRERFLREIQIAAKLNHPHVLALHDSGEAEELLYYVMPYVEGETLEERLRREQQLSIEDAVRIARDVASALAYAHGRGVIHRDIKPGNILLSDGQAVVADFGLARAVTQAKSTSAITASGITIGTPAYMSPEQVSGETEIDGRSDVYSLGCVLYELLAGDPPYTASNPQGVLAKHAAAHVPSVRTVRNTVPEWLDRAVARALAKAPVDRFQTAAEFEKALEIGDGDAITGHQALRRWRSAAMGAAVVGAGALVWAVVDTPQGGVLPRMEVDTARYAVLPLTRAPGDSGDVEEQLLQDALARWSGIRVVDRFQVNDALAQRRGAPLTGRAALEVSRSLGAGRYVVGEVTRLGDTKRVHVVLFDAVRGRQIDQRGVRIPRGSEGTDSLFRALADGLLFGDLVPADREEATSGTRSAPARRAFTRGYAAITRWELPAADSGLSMALAFDPEYAQAGLWLALARLWAGKPRATWQYVAEQSVAGRHRLSSRDRVMADAVLLMSRGDYSTTCNLWKRLTDQESNDFALWYGYGTCLTRDQGVLRDPRSPSGWRFRSSRHQAQAAFRRAFRLLPSMHRGMQGGAFQEVRRLLITSLSELQPGRAIPPDTGRFSAYPAWTGDTLVMIPFRSADVRQAKTWTRPTTALEALARQRQAFHEIASGWVAAYPESPDALEAMGLALEMLGNARAIDTVRKARELATDDETRIRIATTEVWMRLRLSLPDDRSGLQAVRSMADSLLALSDSIPPSQAGLLSPLASLLGRGHLAADLSRRASDRRAWLVPASVAGDGVALLAYAALGAPAESLVALEDRLSTGIPQAMDDQQLVRERSEWLGRPASMAFPGHRFRSLMSLAGHNDYLLDAQAAFERGNHGQAQAILENVRTGFRAGLPASDIMIDALLPEVQLLTLIDPSRAALAGLDSTLLGQRFIAPNLMADVARAGMLVRAMAWRAEFAAQIHDSTAARRWAAPVLILWSGADSYLNATLRRMSYLTAR